MTNYNKAYGSIFHRTDKKKESFPDASGNFTVSKAMLEEFNNTPKTADGSFVIQFSGWTKQGPRAGKFLSGNLQVGPLDQAFTAKGQADGLRQEPQQKQGSFDDDEEIPF